MMRRAVNGGFRYYVAYLLTVAGKKKDCKASVSCEVLVKEIVLWLSSRKTQDEFRVEYQVYPALT